MAEGLMRAALERAGVAGNVHSVGLVTEHRPASAHGVTAMSRRGIDISSHRSRIVMPSHIAPADLILCMELQHVREVAVLDMRAFPRTFTLPELARKAPQLGMRRPDESVEDWIARASAGRRPTDMLGTRPADEIADPLGGSLRDYETTAVELEDHIDTVVSHLFPTNHGGASCE